MASSSQYCLLGHWLADYTRVSPIPQRNFKVSLSKIVDKTLAKY
jgi:hypothetical protein